MYKNITLENMNYLTKEDLENNAKTKLEKATDEEIKEYALKYLIIAEQRQLRTLKHYVKKKDNRN